MHTPVVATLNGSTVSGAAPDLCHDGGPAGPGLTTSDVMTGYPFTRSQRVVSVALKVIVLRSTHNSPGRSRLTQSACRVPERPIAAHVAPGAQWAGHTAN